VNIQGGPKQLYIFQHTISLELFKIKRCWFYNNVHKSLWWNVITNFWQIYYIFFVKRANNYCIIGDVICINMHHLTADDKALILALGVEKCWNVDKMILEFPNIHWKRQTLYYLVWKIDQTGSAARLSGSGRPRTISQDLIDGAINQWSKRLMMVIQAQGGHVEHRLQLTWRLMNITQLHC